MPPSNTKAGSKTPETKPKSAGKKPKKKVKKKAPTSAKSKKGKQKITNKDQTTKDTDDVKLIEESLDLVESDDDGDADSLNIETEDSDTEMGQAGSSPRSEQGDKTKPAEAATGTSDDKVVEKENAESDPQNAGDVTARSSKRAEFFVGDDGEKVEGKTEETKDNVVEFKPEQETPTELKKKESSNEMTQPQPDHPVGKNLKQQESQDEMKAKPTTTPRGPERPKTGVERKISGTEKGKMSKSDSKNSVGSGSSSDKDNKLPKSSSAKKQESTKEIAKSTDDKDISKGGDQKAGEVKSDNKVTDDPKKSAPDSGNKSDGDKTKKLEKPASVKDVNAEIPAEDKKDNKTTDKPKSAGGKAETSESKTIDKTTPGGKAEGSKTGKVSGARAKSALKSVLFSGKKDELINKVDDPKQKEVNGKKADVGKPDATKPGDKKTDTKGGTPKNKSAEAKKPDKKWNLVPQKKELLQPNKTNGDAKRGSLSVPGKEEEGRDSPSSDKSGSSRRGSIRSVESRLSSFDLSKLTKAAVEAHQNNEEKEEEAQKPVADDSYTRSAIPYLPLSLAILCFMLNMVVPGLGTMMSGIAAFCCGKTRINTKDSAKFSTFCVNMMVGTAQLFTITFMLVGWFWSFTWGIYMIILAVDYKKEQKAKREKEVQAKALAAFSPQLRPWTLKT